MYINPVLEVTTRRLKSRNVFKKELPLGWSREPFIALVYNDLSMHLMCPSVHKLI